jgi:ATP-binding cassette subfamily B protein
MLSSSQPQTALQCLVRVTGHYGVDLSVDRLRQTYAVDNAHSQVTLLRIAKDAFGAQAVDVALDVEQRVNALDRR